MLVSIPADEEPMILDRLDLEEIPFRTEDGSTWDEDASGPDIFFRLINGSNDEVVFQTSIKYNIREDDLPVFWHIEEKRIAMEGKTWRLIMYDEDDGQQQIMADWAFNVPIGEDELKLKTSGKENFELELEFQETDF